MGKVLKFAVAGFLLSASAFAAAPTTLPEPKAAYDATVAIDYGDAHITSVVNADGPKERRAAVLARGGEQTIIVRRDENKIYLLVPALNVAMTLDDGQVPGGFDLNVFTTIPVQAEGTDTIDGLKATRYHAAGATAQGTFDGLIWMTADGIPLQITGTVTQNAKATPVKITTSNLHVRAQDPALFEIPSNMKVMPAGMANLLKGVKAPKGTSQ